MNSFLQIKLENMAPSDALPLETLRSWQSLFD